MDWLFGGAQQAQMDPYGMQQPYYGGAEQFGTYVGFDEDGYEAYSNSEGFIWYLARWIAWLFPWTVQNLKEDSPMYYDKHYGSYFAF